MVDTLYHYCSLDTLLAILKNKTLRLSDVNRSNDLLEGRALLEFIVDLAMEEYQASSHGHDQLIDGMENEKAMRYLLETRMQNLRDNTDAMFFATCFSEDGDLLGQWREYADKGRGVSVGFSKRILQKMVRSTNIVKINKVRYVDEQNHLRHLDTHITHDLLQSIYYAVGQGLTENLLTNPHGGSFYDSIVGDVLVQSSMFIKNKSFCDEKEWRMVLFDDECKKSGDNWNVYYKGRISLSKKLCCPSGIEFRSVGNDIIPYMDVCFKNYIEDGLLTEIVIGPNCKLKDNDLNQLLRHFDYREDNEIVTRHSKSSYIFN